MSAKVTHVKEIKKEVIIQLKKYKEIFSFLKIYQTDKTQRFDADKRRLVRNVINLSIPKVKNKRNIDNKLQCIKSEYRKNAKKFLDILEKIENDLDMILEADRNTIIRIIQKNEYSISCVNDEYLKSILEKIFNYEAFSTKDKARYNAYTLTENLRIISCPYCNRIYTLTVICRPTKNGEDTNYVTRPELDHYFPKSKYPLFGLSFNNLLPSCSTCNHLKGDKTDHIKMHHHPYFDNTLLDFHLNGIKYDKVTKRFNNIDEWDILLDENGCNYTKESIEIFRLRDIYKEHKFIIEEMIEKAQEYNQTFINSIESLIGNNNFESEELLERIFGVLPSEEDYCNPLNKFKRAIYHSIRKAQNINVLIK
jgi:5-methylcytosine-specific restriction endonuclease McrA